MHLTAWIYRLRLKMMKMCIVRWKKEKAPTTELVNRLHKNENLFWNFKNSFSKNSIFVVNILVAYQLGEKSSFCSVLSYQSSVGRRHQFGKSCIFCDINWIFFYFNFTVFLLINRIIFILQFSKFIALILDKFVGFSWHSRLAVCIGCLQQRFCRIFCSNYAYGTWPWVMDKNNHQNNILLPRSKYNAFHTSNWKMEFIVLD